MFAGRKKIEALHRELQHTRLIVDGLRRDLDRAQKQLRNMDGWWDDFTKTREVTDADTRAFFRETPAALRESPASAQRFSPLQAQPRGARALSALSLETEVEPEAPQSSIRRRFV